MNRSKLTSGRRLQQIAALKNCRANSTHETMIDSITTTGNLQRMLTKNQAAADSPESNAIGDIRIIIAAGANDMRNTVVVTISTTRLTVLERLSLLSGTFIQPVLLISRPQRDW